MTALNKQALREARSGSYIKQCGITSYQPIAEIDHKPVRDFVAMVNPATTLALLDENLQLQREKDAIEAVALALRDDMRHAREQLEAAEKCITEQREYYEGVIADGSKRIAELEAREVMLPAEKFCPSEYAGSQYWEETEVWNKAISACAVAIRAAGIKVKES
ncbi:ead/Ea22-like family protein [Salmonella enterica subsp. diarizonae]|nr:ead/Ea22-like family protein [Salmonella enterica subsp. diarizonae]